MLRVFRDLTGVGLFLMVFTMGAAWAATAPSAEEIRESISTTLKERHPTDTGDWWRGLGPEAPAVIVAMAQETTSVFQRTRLVGALAWFDAPLGVEFLRSQIEGSPESSVRHAAMRSLGISQGDAALDFLLPYLQSKDVQTRMTAAQVLRRMPGERARGELDKYLKTEQVTWIARKVEEAPQPGASPSPSEPGFQNGLRREFGESFDGYWIGMAPSPGSVPQLLSRTALWVGSWSPSRQLEGELRIASALGDKVEQVLKLTGVGGKADRLKGVLVGAGGNFPFEAQLSQRQGVLILELRAAKKIFSLVAVHKKQ